MKIISCVLTIVYFLLLSGCDKQTQNASSEVNARIQSLEMEVGFLKSNQFSLHSFNVSQNQFDTNVELRIQWLEYLTAYTNVEQRIQNLELETASMRHETKWIILDPTTHNYQRVDTSVGMMLVLVKAVVPYLDGYKVTILIGNPYKMDFNGFLASCRWGASYTYTNGEASNVKEVQDSQKSKDLALTDVLASGNWNPVELVITPATADEIKNLRISITPNDVLLYSKPDAKL